MARVFTAGRGFTVQGGYPPPDGLRRVVASKQEAEAGVADLAANKVDLVKIWVDDHLGRTKKFPLDFASAIISSAHKNRIKVAAHIFYLDDAKALVEAGLDGLVHSVRDRPVDQALIDSMKKRGAWQAASTLTRELSTFIWAERPKFLDDPFFTRSVSPKVVETLKSASYVDRVKSDPDFAKYPGFLDTAKKNLKRLADAGVKYAFGTDTGPPGRFQGFFEQLEMELMVDSGLTPAQVIRAATGSAAEFLGAKDLGTLERGKWADLIVLGRDPLADIKNSRSIEAVYIAGNRVN
jgi:imidazolonepropionase-like amidohydrolase